jgi:hypothetical protein
MIDSLLLSEDNVLPTEIKVKPYILSKAEHLFHFVKDRGNVPAWAFLFSNPQFAVDDLTLRQTQALARCSNTGLQVRSGESFDLYILG